MIQKPTKSHEDVAQVSTFKQKDPETKHIMSKEEPKMLPKEL